MITGESVKLYSPLRISSSWAIEMLSPLGTSGMYFVTGSSRLSLPSWASSRVAADVIVLVMDAIRKWVSAAGRVFSPSFVVPDAATNSPCGVRNITRQPGMSNSSAVWSTMACSAALSIVFRADAGAEADVLGVDGAAGPAQAAPIKRQDRGRGHDRRSADGVTARVRCRRTAGESSFGVGSHHLSLSIGCAFEPDGG